MVTSVRGIGLDPTTSLRAESGCTGFMNAAFGLRFFVAIFPPLLTKFLTIEFISNVWPFVSIFLPSEGSEETGGARPSAVRGKRCVRFLPRGKWVLEKMIRGSEELFTAIFDREPSVAWQGTALMISKRREAGFTDGFNKAGGLWDAKRTSF